MRNFQTTSLPSLSLGIQPVHILNRIYEKDRILADSHFSILQIFHLKSNLCILTDRIRII